MATGSRERPFIWPVIHLTDGYYGGPTTTATGPAPYMWLLSPIIAQIQSPGKKLQFNFISRANTHQGEQEKHNNIYCPNIMVIVPVKRNLENFWAHRVVSVSWVYARKHRHYRVCITEYATGPRNVDYVTYLWYLINTSSRREFVVYHHLSYSKNS